MKDNNLLLTLDDATKVAMRFLRDYSDLGKDEFEGIEEVLRSELEQKCYISKESKRLAALIGEINPESITKSILNDELARWCRKMQVVLQGYIANYLFSIR